jgi:hypothetical protein
MRRKLPLPVTSMVSRVGVDPISDPDTAIIEMLLAALGRPNFTGRDRQTYCGALRFQLHRIARAGPEQVDRIGPF